MRKLFIAVGAVAIILSLWGFWLEPASLRVSAHRLAVPAWPVECNDLRVAVLADLHVGSPFNGIENLQRIVKTTQQAKPDLILLAGDFVIHGVVGGKFVPPEDAAKILGQLHAELGVYAVLGNHDWWLDRDRVYAALESQQIPVLEDRAIKVANGNCSFSLVGVSDFWEGSHDLSKALSDIPVGATLLLFTHNPDVFPEVPKRVTLTIAGHTHGGQVYIPGIGRPVVPSSYGERYAIGHIVEQEKHLFVSSGVGTSILPVRFLVPPEVTLLILKNKK